MIIVLPMAGRGKRFADVGYSTPKPLIPVAGKPMFVWALESIRQIQYSRLIVIALQEHQDEYDIANHLKSNGFNEFELVLIPEVTEGQLCTVLAGKNYFVSDEGILIIPSDTYVDSEIGQEILSSEKSIDGIISVFNLSGDHWSFVRTNASGHAVEVAEKTRISDHASTGLYYFSNCLEFASKAQAMIDKNERTKGEFYIMPLYQKYIDSGKKVIISNARKMWDMGNPVAKETFERYLRNR